MVSLAGIFLYASHQKGKLKEQARLEEYHKTEKCLFTEDEYIIIALTSPNYGPLSWDQSEYGGLFHSGE